MADDPKTTIEIEFSADMIERVMDEWQEENPMRTVESMPPAEFARRMMIEMQATARKVSDT